MSQVVALPAPAEETPKPSPFGQSRVILTAELVEKAPEHVYFKGYVMVTKGHGEFFTLDRKELVKKLAKTDMIADCHTYEGKPESYYLINR